MKTWFLVIIMWSGSNGDITTTTIPKEYLAYDDCMYAATVATTKIGWIEVNAICIPTKEKLE